MANPRYTLAKLLTVETLRRLAGAAAYERGVAVFQRGQVVACGQEGETLQARVLGTRSYEVRLWIRAGRLQYTCDCPAAAEGAFCKHCVAVGWQGRQDAAARRLA
jgi:uncharacterized Zn finger protein